MSQLDDDILSNSTFEPSYPRQKGVHRAGMTDSEFAAWHRDQEKQETGNPEEPRNL